MDQFLTLALHNVVGEHNGFHPVHFQSHLEGIQRVGGNTQVTNFSGSLGFHQRFQSAAGSNYLLQLCGGGVVNLIQVNVIGAQVLQAGFNVLCHSFPGSGHALGGQDKIFPDALQGVA